MQIPKTSENGMSRLQDCHHGILKGETKFLSEDAFKTEKIWILDWHKQKSLKIGIGLRLASTRCKYICLHLQMSFWITELLWRNLQRVFTAKNPHLPIILQNGKA